MGAQRCDGAFGFASEEDRAYAINTVETVTWLAGRPDYFDELGEAGKDHDLFGSIGRSRSSRVFDWLMAALSYQGISDAVARSYMATHERPRRVKIARGVKSSSCPLLKSYWHFHGCGYRKTAQTCAKPNLMTTCSLPVHDFRNGNLNQLAYSLFLFIRDVADGDLVGWIDQASGRSRDRPGRRSPWPIAAGDHRAARGPPWRFAQGPEYGAVRPPIDRQKAQPALGGGAVGPDRCRYPGPQFSGSNRHFGPGGGRPRLWPPMLRPSGLRFSTVDVERGHRCPTVQPRLSKNLPALHSARDLGLLRR